MSGYLAFLGGPPAAHARGGLAAAAAWLAPRSPDGLAGWSAGSATLVQGLLRLYPADAAHAAVATLDGGLRLAGDVRIDARDGLCQALGRRGDHAATDAELVLHAWRAWGEGCVDRLRGDFSFVIWDERRQEAFFATDHFAVRPLFYAVAQDGALAVSNTLGALRRVPGVPAEVDDVAVADYLLFGMSMEEGGTFFSGVRRLQRGHCARWSAAGGVRARRYWALAPLPELRLRNGREYVETFRDLLSAAVRDRLRGAPVSIEMSGGLDSPLLAALAQRELRAAGVRDGVRGWCFSHAGSFPDPEPPYAEYAAMDLGIPLRVFDAAAVPALDGDPALRGAPLQPLAPISHAVAREMLGHSRIALSGFDGDALLKVSLGRFWRGMVERRDVAGVAGALLGLAPVAVHNRRLPRVRLRSALRRRLHPPAEPPLPGWLRDDWVARLGLRERARALAAPPAAAGDDPRAHARGEMQTAIWKDLFESYDPGSTGLPHVVMHPLMDLRVVSFLQALPPVPWCIEKHLLRRAGRGLLPPEILRRRKTPLAGDPLQSRRREVAAALTFPDAFRDVERWVDVPQLQRLDVAAGGDVSWPLAHLASLTRWLRAQEPSAPPAGFIVPVIPWKGSTDVCFTAEQEAVP